MRGDEVGMTGSAASAPSPTWVGVIAAGVLFAFGLLGCVATGLCAAVASESDAMAVAYIGVPLALGGVVAPVIAALFRRSQPALAIGMPIGCGCATIVTGVVGVVVFFTAIWPSL